MTTAPTIPTYHDEAAADDAMRRHNRTAKADDLAVVVDGPEDGTWCVLSLSDAVEGGFFYRWAA